MRALSLEEKRELVRILSGSKSQIIQNALMKITEEKEKITYARDKNKIRQILKKGFQHKQNVKIQYYSLSSDETKYRVVSIYKFNEEYIIAYCHLRKEERTFVTKRILGAALLKETYELPKNWKAKSIVRTSK